MALLESYHRQFLEELSPIQSSAAQNPSSFQEGREAPRSERFPRQRHLAGSRAPSCSAVLVIPYMLEEEDLVAIPRGG